MTEPNGKTNDVDEDLSVVEESAPPQPPEAPDAAPTSKAVVVGWSPIPLLLDVAARWVAFVALRNGLIGHGWFWAFQFSVAPVLFLSMIRTEGKVRRARGIAVEVSLDAEPLGSRGFLLVGAIVGGLVGTAAVLAGLHPALRVLGVLSSIPLYGFWVGIIAVFSYSPRLRGEPRTSPQVEEPEVERVEDFDGPLPDMVDQVEVVEEVAPVELTGVKRAWRDSDERAVEQAQLEVTASALHHRVDAYTLESALIGAISFSAFIQIIFSDEGSLARTQAFVDGVSVASIRALVLSMPMSGESTSDGVLLIGLTLLTLVASLLFLLVIVSRLQFNTALQDLSGLLKSSGVLADREVQALLLVEGSAPSKGLESLMDRVETLGAEADKTMKGADEALKFVTPVVEYMGMFRHLGVGCYLAVLVCCAALLSGEVAAAFVGLGAMAYLYARIERLIRTWRFAQRLQWLEVPSWLQFKRR